MGGKGGEVQSWIGRVCGWVGVCIESVNGLKCSEEYVEGVCGGCM